MKRVYILSAAAFALSCLVCAPLFAADYYMSEAGDDAAAGSQEAPWRTFAKANSSVKPGDTVHVLPGHYEGAKLNAKGTAEAPITYASVEPRKAVVDLGGFPTNATEGSRISIWGDYTVFDGFEVSTGRAETGRAANAAVAVYRCKGTVVKNCHCHTNDRWGIFTAWAADLTLENNECHNNRREHGIYVSNGGDNPHIVGNKCYDNGGCGIQINTDGGTIHGAILERNILWNNNTVGGQSINFDGVAKAVVQNNVIIIDRRNGIALYRIDGGEVCTDNLIVNNTFINLGGSSGILFNDGAHDNYVFNNIMWTEDVSKEMMEGNVLANAVANNAFNSRAAGKDPVAIPMTIGNALAAVFVNPEARDFRLKADSPLVDAGIAELAGKKAPSDDFAGNPRPSGPAVDIGACELAK